MFCNCFIIICNVVSEQECIDFVSSEYSIVKQQKEKKLLLEKISFLLGILGTSLLMITASAFSNLVPIVASVLILISLILIYVVKSQWTNVLAHEMFCSSLNSKFADLKRGTDEKSTQVLDYTQQVLYHSLFWNKRTNLYSLWNISYIKLPHFQYAYKKQWLSQRDSIVQECNARGIEKIFPEVEFFKHGLATCNEKILEHIRNHDIFDLGAYVGDSALILSEYTNHTVFSFELSHKTASKFREIMQKKNVKNVVLTEMGISDTKQEIYFSDTGKLNSGAGSTGTTKAILTTVDNEVDRLQAKVGFIKADLEGYGLKAIHGAIETIKRYRPVISIGIYHNYEELFEIKPFMEKNVENYVFEFQLHRFSEGKFVELTLFCYPAELK